MLDNAITLEYMVGANSYGSLAIDGELNYTQLANRR